MKSYSDKNTKQPKLRFPGFTGEWEEKRLGDICALSKKKINPLIEAINYKCLELEHLEQETGRIIGYTDLQLQKSIKNKFEPGDVLYGKLRPYLKKFYKPDFEGVCSSEIFVLQGKKISNDYLYYLIQTDNFNQIANLSTGSKMPRSDWHSMAIVGFNIPTLPEQKKIAGFLSDIDTKIEKLTRKKELTEQYKKGAMQKIFSQKIRFKVENGKNYPDWEEKKLGEVAEVLMGQSPPSDSYNESKDGIPLIQGNADIKNRVTFPKIYTSEPTKLCHTGDVLMTVRAPVGAIAKSEHEACIGRGVCAIRAKNKINSNFLYQFLITYEPQWKNLEQGSTFSAVNGKDIKGMEINMPCLEEQKKIVDFLIDLDTRIQHIDKELVTLKEFKKGLLQGMFV